MREFQEELAEAVEALDRHYSDLKATARQRLGSLFNAGDYPESLSGCSPSTPIFLRWNPRTICSSSTRSSTKRNASRVQNRFDEAVQLAEEAFTAELAKLVSHLTERLCGQEDGKPKVFRDGVVENLTEFFARFRQLNVRSNEQLDQLVGRRPAGHPGRGAAGTSRQRRPAAARRHGNEPRAERAGWPAGGPAAAEHPPPPEVMEHAMQLIITPGGAVRCIYSEDIDLAALGSPTISRASHVEPDQQGRWWADLSPVGGPSLGPFPHAARPWRPSTLGWRPTGSAARAAGSRSPFPVSSPLWRPSDDRYP